MRSAAALLLLLATPGVASAEKVRVAVAKVSGPKAAKPSKLERGIRFGIKTVGAQSISAAALSKAAREVGVKAASAEGARAVGADYLVITTVKKRRKKFVAKAELIRASDGKTLKTFSKRYSRGRAGLKVGKLIGKTMGKKANDLGPVAPDSARAPPPPVVSTPIAPPPPRASASASIEPKDDEDDATTATVEREPRNETGPEYATLNVGLAGGLQAGSAYTVAVGDNVTGLAYRLSPLVLVRADVLARIPSTGLFVGADFDFAPVKYAVETMPPVATPEPSGQFIGVSGRVGYRVLDLPIVDALTLTLSPVVSFSWDSLHVQDQEPSIVLSWSALDFSGGLDVGFRIFDDAVVEGVFRGGYVFRYAEKPTTTGKGGSGFTIAAGARARYWVISNFGIQLDLLYTYHRVGLSGAGTRIRFMEDDDLVDARIFAADLKVGFGLLLAI